MNTKISTLKAYIKSIFGVSAQFSKVKPNIPFGIQALFDFFKLEIKISNKKTINLLVAMQLNDEYPGITALNKRLSIIENMTTDILVYVNNGLSSDERRSLISHHINFIVSNRQFFVPELGIDLREVFNRKKNIDKNFFFSPATQAILIQLLFDPIFSKLGTSFTANELLGSYNYSRVTLSKCISELISSGFLTLESSEYFRERRYLLKYNKKEMLKRALLIMSDPVKKRVWVDNIPVLTHEVCYAGETALAEYTMIASSSKPVFAMTQATFSKLINNKLLNQVTHIDDVKAQIEIWRYLSPKVLTEIVDEISLYITLKDNNDERIQLALNEMRDGYSWMRFED